MPEDDQNPFGDAGTPPGGGPTDDAQTGGSAQGDASKGGKPQGGAPTGGSPAKKRRRRRPRKKKPSTAPSSDPGLATSDMSMVEEETHEKLDQPSEPSPFDLAASFSASEPGNSESKQEPKPPEPSPEPTPGPDPFTPEPPAPEPHKPDEPSMPEPPKPESTAPESDSGASPFDLAGSPDSGPSKDEPPKSPSGDSFGDYESPFGSSEPKPDEHKPDEPKHDEFKPDEPKLDEPKPKDEPPMKEEPAPFETAGPSDMDQPDGGSPFGDDEPDMGSSPESSPEPIEGEVVQETPFDEAGPSSDPMGADPIMGDEPIEEGSLEDMEMSGSLSDRAKQLLNEANLTTRHLKFCCGGVVAVVVVILIAFFILPKILSGDFLFFGDDDDSPKDPVHDTTDDDDDDSTPPVDTPPVTSDGEAVWVDPSIYNGLLLGDPSATFDGDIGVDTGVLVGDEDQTALYLTEFQTYIADLEDLFNMYFVDLNDLLDGSTNRTETLDEYIQELKDTYNDGVDTYEDITALKNEIGGEFSLNEPIKEAMEVLFFEQMEAFEGIDAEETLTEFIGVKQEQVDLKAKFYTYANLETRYETVLVSMYDRIQDIETNREALIAGVQVVDFDNSDLDLILTEDDLEE